MGCGLTKSMNTDLPFMAPKQRRDTAPLSVDDLKHSLLEEYTHVTKRFGHPQYYKQDGYTLGVRVDGLEKFHTFYVGHSRATNNKMTVKEFHLGTCGEQNIINEVLLLAKLSSHSAVPELKELFITDWSVYMVTSKIESVRLSHFYDFRPNHKNQFTLNDTRVIIKSVIEAVDYCHSQQIVVRNLTPKNISILRTGGTFEVKLCDFSLAVSNGCSDYLCDSSYFNWSQVPFMSPEALLGNEYSFPMDMWSVGVLLFMMATYSLPFTHDDDVELMHRITHSIYQYPVACDVPMQVRHLISTLLFVSTDMRLTDKESLNNAWLNSVEVTNTENQQL